MAVGGKVKFEVDNGMSIGQIENCGMCKKREHDGFCSQCDIYVCQTCYDLHLNIKQYRDHSLLLDSEGRDRGESTIRFEICDEHKGQEVKSYCTEHKCCVCMECIVLHHKSCKWEYIVDASNRFQDSGDLARLLEEVSGLEFTLGKYMEAIDKHTKTAETIDKDVVSDIETFAESLEKYVAGSKQQALDDAKVRESVHQQVLDKLKVDIQSLVSQVEEVITAFGNEDMVHKLFILAVATTPKVDQIQNEIAAIDCENVITDYKFRQGNFLKRMMCNTRPIGRLTDASHIEEEEEDDFDIKLKKEYERSQGLEQQLEENQKMMSKLKKDLHDMEQTYGGVVKDKQSLTDEVCALRDKNQKTVKEKKYLEQEICTLKSESQSCRKEKESIEHELCILRTTHGRVVKDKQCLEQHMGVQKSSNHNVISKLNKDIGDLKKNYDSQTKKKEQRRRREMRETGGGEAPNNLKDWEEKLITVIPEASLVGVCGVEDTFASNTHAEELIDTIVGDTTLIHDTSVNVQLQVSSINEVNESENPIPSSSKKKRTTLNLNDAQMDFYSSNAELAREKVMLLRQQTKTEKEKERFFKAAAVRMEASDVGDIYRLLTEQ